MNNIKEFLQKNIKDIESGKKSVDDLLKEKSMRCLEIPWVIMRFLETAGAAERKILDLGTSFFDRAYFKVFFEEVISPAKEFYAIDIIPFRAERFADYVNADLLRGKIKFTKGDMRQAPFPDNFFDLIFCISVVEHIGFDEEKAEKSISSFNRPGELPKNLPSLDNWSEDFKAMKEVGRVLRPGGKILLTVPFGAAEIISEKDSLGLYAFSVQYDENRLNELIEAASAKVSEKRIFIYDENTGWAETPHITSPSQRALACVELVK